MTNIEMQRLRVNTKGFKAGDIKHEGFLIDQQIADIPVSQVYQWVRTGQWKQKDFNKWLKVLRVVEEQ